MARRKNVLVFSTAVLFFLKFQNRASGQETTPAQVQDDNSCANRCEESYFPGKPCYCNGDCTKYENCCEDYFGECVDVVTDDWVEYNGHIYRYYEDETITGVNAAAACKDQGALLFSVNDQEEADFFITDIAQERALSVFVGGSDDEREGTWVWADGTRVPLPGTPTSHWYQGQPDDKASEQNCLVLTNHKYWTIPQMVLEKFYWIDLSCTVNSNREIQGFVCETTAVCHPNPCQNNGTCHYTPGPTEYSCECKDGFVGDHCEIEVIDGELWTRCGDTILTKSQGIVTSPLYPKTYPANVRCDWLIQVEEGKTISLNLESFDVELSKDCVFDSLTIFDGSNSSSYELLGPICGNLQHKDFEIQQYLTSSSSSVFIQFHTDHSVHGNGFSLQYEEEKCGLGTGNSGCGTRQHFTYDCGSINILEGPSGVDSCEWFITVTEGNVINITFTEFSMKDTGMDCSGGHLAVYDGQDEESWLLEKYCGERFPWSIQSTSNQVYVKLFGIKWNENMDKIKLSYQAIDINEWRMVNPFTIVTGAVSGTISADGAPIHIRTKSKLIRKWLLKTKVGDKLLIEWNLSTNEEVSMQIFEGFSEESGLLVDVSSDDSKITNKEGSLELSTFQALVVLTSGVDDSTLHFSLHYEEKEWIPDLSGCYRPLYYSNSKSLGTENNLVKKLEPVVVMVSDSSYAQDDPGYDNGLYCKWLIKGSPGDQLVFEILDAVIKPISSDCDYDGVVVYDGNTTSARRHGPFCGSSNSLKIPINLYQEQALVVFYSDKRGTRRSEGVMRSLISLKEMDTCKIYEMTNATNVLQSQCGVLLSPNFPGMVPPSQWSWMFQGQIAKYFIILVHYVKGPSVVNDCTQYMTVSEIPSGTTNIIQANTEVLKICGSTDNSIPPRQLKIPPGQKFMVTLTTNKKSIYQRWEFKISFEMSEMETPADTENDGSSCPTDYIYYKGHCYTYHTWVARHYKPEEYTFQETWQNALDQCRQDNASLLSIYDQEEEYFIKYALATTWFWNDGSSYQGNHRLIYLGLNNKDGEYSWIDGAMQGYADWYIPRADWEQPILAADSLAADLLNLNKPQPNADLGSLCSVLVVVSPFESLNWAKIPCDYPIFRAGVICKKTADLLRVKRSVTQTVQTVKTPSLELPPVESLRDSTIKDCPPGWVMVNGRCLMLFTDYRNTFEKSLNGSEVLSYTQAVEMCSDHSGMITKLDEETFEQLQKYLNLWHHGVEMGGIWLSKDETETSESCSMIKVHKRNPIDTIVFYSKINGTCNYLKINLPQNVLCETMPTEYEEKCHRNEFHCSSKECVSVDSVCDGYNDCGDMSDETTCDCGPSTFKCDDGKCIPISLRCDYIDHCEDKSDEKSCVKESCKESEFMCSNGECIEQEFMCDFKHDCKDKSDESEETCNSVCKGFQCFSGICLKDELTNDLISDCPGVSMEDEDSTEKTLTTFWDLYQGEVAPKNGGFLEEDTPENETLSDFHCSEGQSYAQCRSGEPHCFLRAKTCIYDVRIVDEEKGVKVQDYCREGSHIRSHCGEAECPGMFHCPGYYCIAQRKVCDGIKDCPYGEDETSNMCSNYTCPGLFKCKDETFCISHKEVCDGKFDCRAHGEDEKYCNQQSDLCGSKCTCTGYIMDCSNSSLTSLSEETLPPTSQIRALLLSDNDLVVTLKSFMTFHWLGRLDLSHNRITKLPVGAFQYLVNLFELNLSGNKLEFLDPGTFIGLVSLKLLDLSNNLLFGMNRETFAGLFKLDHLIITGNLLEDVTMDTFVELNTLRVLNSDAFKFCCIAEQAEVCTPEGDEFSSCKDLMANSTLQMSIWVLGWLAFVGNFFVVAWRFKSDRKKVSSFFIINLGISDFLMGLYLLIIAAADTYYRGVYIIHADAWRASALCTLAGVLSMVSSEVSVFMLTAITMDRAFTIVFPLKMKRFRLYHARFLAGSGWVVCICLALIPVMKIPYFEDSFFGRTGVCLPFNMDNQKLAGWEYAAFIFLVMNLISFIFIFAGYIAIFVVVKSKIKKMENKSTSTVDEYVLAKKLVIIVATDFLCWVPIILIGFAALGGASIPPVVSAWVAVFILPLNSAVNPILYTISAIDCSKKKKGGTSNSYSNSGNKTVKTSMGDPSYSQNEASNGVKNGRSGIDNEGASNHSDTV